MVHFWLYTPPPPHPPLQVFPVWMIKYSSTATPEYRLLWSFTLSTPASLWQTRTASGQGHITNSRAENKNQFYIKDSRYVNDSVSNLMLQNYCLKTVCMSTVVSGTGRKARGWTTSTTGTLVTLASLPWSTWMDMTVHYFSLQQVWNSQTQTHTQWKVKKMQYCAD